jgi:hypothetical protein
VPLMGNGLGLWDGGARCAFVRSGRRADLPVPAKTSSSIVVSASCLRHMYDEAGHPMCTWVRVAGMFEVPVKGSTACRPTLPATDPASTRGETLFLCVVY